MTEIKRIAHAFIMIKTDDKTIYIDPYFTDSMPEKIKEFYQNPEKADLLLITHEHHDHCDPSTFENMITEDTKIVAPENCRSKINRNFTAVKVGDTTSYEGIRIEVVPAYNIKRKRDSGEPFHPKGEGVGYMITIKDKTIYHPGDTENIPEMKDIDDVDIAFLPIDGTYTMDIDEAVEAAKVIGPNTIIPIHERDANPAEFKDKVENETDTEVLILGEGELFTVN